MTKTSEKVAVEQVDRWLRAISEWLLTTDNDMKLPSGILDTDPLDIADELASLRTPEPAGVERAQVDRLREDLRKFALFHASGGHEGTWEELDALAAEYLSAWSKYDDLPLEHFEDCKRLTAALSAVAEQGEGEKCIDPRTGRKIGDHGTANQAIEFALNGNNAAWTQETEFLRCWREGNLDEWPEFYAWIATLQPSGEGT